MTNKMLKAGLVALSLVSTSAMAADPVTITVWHMEQPAARVAASRN